jgi:hypothetical protein
VSKPPPENLMEWSKPMLVKELTRLRAILREHADRPHDEARSGGEAVHTTHDPYARGASVLDTREAVLLDYNEVILVDRTTGDEPPAVALILEGRVNLQRRRVKQMYLFGSDGAAALIAQLVGLAARAGGAFADQFKADVDRAIAELP